MSPDLWPPRQQRFCCRCFKDLGVEVLGDEFHALNYCVRAQAHRFNTAAKMRSHLERHEILVDAGANVITDLFAYISQLPVTAQPFMWKSLGQLMVHIQDEIANES